MDDSNEESRLGVPPYYVTPQPQDNPEEGQAQNPKVEQDQQDVPQQEGVQQPQDLQQPPWQVSQQYNPFGFSFSPQVQPHPEQQQLAGNAPHPAPHQYGQYGHMHYPAYFPPAGYGGHPYQVSTQQYDAQLQVHHSPDPFQHSPTPGPEGSLPNTQPVEQPRFQHQHQMQHPQVQQSFHPGYAHPPQQFTHGYPPPPQQFSAGWVPPGYYPNSFGSQTQASGQGSSPDPYLHSPSAQSHAGSPAPQFDQAVHHAAYPPPPLTEPTYLVPPVPKPEVAAAPSPLQGPPAPAPPQGFHAATPFQAPSTTAVVDYASQTAANDTDTAVSTIIDSPSKTITNTKSHDAATTAAVNGVAMSTTSATNDTDMSTSPTNDTDTSFASPTQYERSRADITAYSTTPMNKDTASPDRIIAATTRATSVSVQPQQQVEKPLSKHELEAPPPPYGPGATNTHFRCSAETERLHRLARERMSNKREKQAAAAGEDGAANGVVRPQRGGGELDPINVHDMKHTRACVGCDTRGWKKRTCDRQWPCINCLQLNKGWNKCEYALTDKVPEWPDSSSEGEGDEAIDVASGGGDEMEGVVVTPGPAQVPAAAAESSDEAPQQQQQQQIRLQPALNVSLTEGQLARLAADNPAALELLAQMQALIDVGSSGAGPSTQPPLPVQTVMQVQQKQQQRSPDGPMTLGQLAATRKEQEGVMPRPLGEVVDELSGRKSG